ncbi:unnamed protein product [Leptidea sinapis]|nr:unnamed protein product [Leptidea sinapis]
MPSAEPPPPAENGAPRSELEQLQMRAGQVTDDSLESTRRMMQLCEESEDAGGQALHMLSHQGEYINGIRLHFLHG